jgi:chemotaxis protein methyltransferase CheR
MREGDVFGAEPELVLTDQDLRKVVRLVYDRSGITLHEGKRSLVMARLQKRLRHHGFSSFSTYLTHVERDASGEELVLLLDAIATNHTYFFREEQHFAYLTSRVLTEWRGRASGGPLRVWCAACSTGEEPYTLAMSLADAAPAVDFGLLASDLSTKALKAARSGVYRMSSVESLPPDLLRRHFERGMGEQEGFARVSASLRKRIAFRNLNLLEIGDVGERFDVIFCRNAMIYFDKAVQQRVVTMLERHLKPGGYLFISHSESLNGVSHGLRWMAPAVYQRGARD